MADVAAIGERTASFTFDFCSDRFARIHLAAGDDDIRTPVRHRERHLAPQPPAAAGNEGDFAREIQ